MPRLSGSHSLPALVAALAFSPSSVLASTITYSITNLGTVVPTAINNTGQVVGTSGGHAFLWQSGSGMQDLGTLGGCPNSVVSG